MGISVERPPPPCYAQPLKVRSKSFVVNHLRRSMPNDRFEVVIVGAGLSGVAAALTLARNGVEVLVIERGDFPGATAAAGRSAGAEGGGLLLADQRAARAGARRPTTTTPSS